ncbi:MAG: 4a-hydroxytetrahydrobiopterin dehydratase [Candidatus Limnocylindria bacterium]
MPAAPLLTDDELADGLTRLPEWRHEGGAITRTIKLRDFRGAIALVNRVADAAEEANHHPDIEIRGYNRVTLTLVTHAVNGLTQRDLDLAARIDELARD